MTVHERMSLCALSWGLSPLLVLIKSKSKRLCVRGVRAALHCAGVALEGRG